MDNNNENLENGKVEKNTPDVLKDKYKGVHLLNNRYKTIKVAHFARKSIIYKAMDITNETIVAVKEMTERFDSQEDRTRALELFNNEVDILVKFDHPGLPKILDFFEEEGKYFIVKEFIKGVNLDKKIRNNQYKPFYESKILKWTRQILDILNYLHNLNPPYIYKNLKPANIMVDKQDRVYLIDYDIDRIFDPKSQGGKDRGSSGFESPELEKGLKADSRCDIYSLGMVLRFLFSGADPSKPGYSSRFKRVKDVNAKISPWFDDLILKMVEPNLENRLSSANEVLEKIEKNILTADSVNDSKDDEIINGAEPVPGISAPPAPEALDEKKKKTGKFPSFCMGCIVLFAVALITLVVLGAVYSKDLMSSYYYSLGKSARNKKQYKEALRNFDKSLDYKESFLIYKEIGDALFILKDYNKALRAYNAAVKFDPKGAKISASKLALTNLRYGEVCSDKSDDKAADDALKKAMEIDPENEMFKNSKAALKRGNLQLDVKKYGKALFNFNWALKIDPDCSDAYLGRAEAYYHKKNKKIALFNLQKAFKLNPELHENSRIKIFSALFKKEAMKASYERKFNEAVEYFNLALKVNPKDADAYLGRAESYFFMDKREKALMDVQSALKINPRLEKKRKIRGMAMLFCRKAVSSFKKRNYDEAVDNFNLALQIAPKNYDTYLWRAEAHFYQGKKDQAVADVKKALSLNDSLKRNSKIIKLTALFCRDGVKALYKRKYKEALKNYNMALEVSPKNTRVMMAISDVYKARKDYREAYNRLKIAKEFDVNGRYANTIDSQLKSLESKISKKGRIPEKITPSPDIPKRSAAEMRQYYVYHAGYYLVVKEPNGKLLSLETRNFKKSFFKKKKWYYGKKKSGNIFLFTKGYRGKEIACDFKYNELDKVKVIGVEKKRYGKRVSSSCLIVTLKRPGSLSFTIEIFSFKDGFKKGNTLYAKVMGKTVYIYFPSKDYYRYRFKIKNIGGIR